MARPEGPAPTIAIRLITFGLSCVIIELTRTLRRQTSDHEMQIITFGLGNQHNVKINIHGGVLKCRAPSLQVRVPSFWANVKD